MENTGNLDPAFEPKEAIQGIDDNNIIQRVLKGEKDLFAFLIRKYNQRLFRVGLSIVNNESDVRDIMQITYIKAYEKLISFKFQSSFSTWLTKILVNESLMQLNRKKESVSRALAILPDIENKVLDRQTPLLKILDSELKSILEASIRQLPEKYRTVFIMREMENMSVSEAMDCLNISESNVKVRLNRAKAMLRTKLRSYLRDEEILKLYEADCDKIVESVMHQLRVRENLY
ncbi:MAG TPA: sigma-70 family RNA polymerase sigma factor [Flavitalea sp.]|nr:sigma-70 family RNA polymerase sigma factor [Flavitalea sp.]